jgi:colanic acid biosynthesis glycosyl transferase WcaI
MNGNESQRPKRRHTRVLVITPQYAPDFGPSAPIYTALCEDLQQMECDVTVITGFPHYGGSDAWHQYSGRLFEEERRNGVCVLRTWVHAVPKGALWRRLLYHGSYNLSSTLAALRVGKPDIVLADAPTLWSGLPLLMTAFLPRVPFIYVVHDIYPDVLVQLGVLSNPQMINLIERVEHLYYGRSAQVSVLSRGFKDNLVQKGVAEDKIVIIPACVDTEFIRPLPPDDKLREQWGLADKFVVLYAGNMGLSQGLDIALKAAQLLVDRLDIVFVFVGEGATKPALQAMAEEIGLSNVRFFPFQPREDVPLVYAVADVSLVSLKRDIVIESVPSKTYTIMASGRPVVATVDQNTEVGRLLDQAQCGFCIEPENAVALAQVILRLYKNDSLRSDMGRRGRDFVVEHYSRQIASKQYHTLIQRFVKTEQQ